MITIMTEEEYKRAGSRRIIEESSLVFTVKYDYYQNPVYALVKNRFGKSISIMSGMDLLQFIETYIKLVA